MRPESQLPRRKTLQEIIMERMGQPGHALEIPPLGPQPTPEPYGPPPQTELQRMESQQRQLNAPPSRKQALLQALTQAAPIGIGALLGGSVGASGAAQGVEQGMAEQTRQRDTRRKTLSERIEAQKNREERMGEREITAQTSANTLAETIRQHDQSEERLRNQPRNIDPNSPQGIAARIQLEQGKPQPPRNIDPLSEQGIAAAINRATQENALPPKPVQPQAPMSPERLTQEQQLIKDRAANRAEPTVVIRTTDAQGNPVTEIQPKKAGAQYAGAPTAQEQNRRSQAKIITNYADHIMGLIDKNPNAVGPILGRLAKGETVLGTVSPEAKALGTALGSFEALQPILHGFRGGSQTVDHFHAVLGDQQLNAVALKASLAEIKNLATQIEGGEETKVVNGVTYIKVQGGWRKK